MSAINDTTLTMRRFSPPTTPGQQHHAATAKEREEENDDEKNLRGLSEFERMRERRIAKNMQRMREMGLEKIAAPPWQSPIVVDGQTPRKVRPPRRFDFFLCVSNARACRRRRPQAAAAFIFAVVSRRFVFQIVQTRAFAEENRRLKRPLIDKISVLSQQKRKNVLIPESQRRRTSRVVKKINYAEDGAPTREENREQSQQQRSRKNATTTTTTTRVARRSVYSVGGRVYDSEKGTTCHWCRQKTVETHVECVGDECQNGTSRPVQFCGMCLRNRHGEDIDLAVASGCWLCPKCRKSCGPGCDLCCNCGPCRKKAGLSPTHQVIRIARENGFDNVHDYLVWEKVGGTPESIKMRKKKFKWGQWVFDETLCAKCPSDDEGEEKIEEVEVEDDDTKNEKVRKDNEEDSDGSSDGDDCFKIVPSSRIYTLNTVNNIKF